MGTGRLAALFVLGICVLGGAAFATSKPMHVTAESSPQGEIKAEIKDEINHDMIILWVNKATLRADLMTWPDEPQKSQILMSFKIAIGKEEGDKQEEGDNRTPEGIYFTLGQLDGKSLPSKYGPLAIPINFPNPMDRIQGKTGHGIWLHGVEEDQRVEAAKVTEGCIAFYNADIQTLAKWLRPNQSVVLITHDASSVNQLEDLQKIRVATQGWANAWKNRDLKTYISYYDPRFHHQIGDLKAYETHKKQVFKGYKKMVVQLSESRVFSNGIYGMSVMNQKFNGDNRFIVNGRKILYWKKTEDGSWGIVNESFDSMQLEFIRFTYQQVADGMRGSPSAKLFDSKAVSPQHF